MKRGTRLAGSRVPLSRSPVDRVLALVGTDEADLSASKASAFARILLLATAVEATESLHYWSSSPRYPLHIGLCVLFWIACLTGWPRRFTRYGALAALLGMLAHNASAFPLNANHHYLIVVCLALVAFFDHDSAEERSALLSALKWLAVIGLFWAGVQKLIWGYYFGGEFLAYAIAENTRFADFFAWLIPADEVVRLRGLTVGEGAGPYRVDSPLFVVMSNLSYVGELVLPPLLLVRRMRPLALPGMLLYVVAIESGARELYFGGLMVALLLLFFERDWIRRLLPLFVVFYLYLLAVSTGILPRWYFT